MDFGVGVRKLHLHRGAVLPEAAGAREDLVLDGAYDVESVVMHGRTSGAAEHDQGSTGGGEAGEASEAGCKLWEVMNGRDGSNEVVVRLGKGVGQGVTGDPGDVGRSAGLSAVDDVSVGVDTGDFGDPLGETDGQESVAGSHVKSRLCR